MNPEVVDLQFSLQGRSVPRDYADALWQAIQTVLPWLDSEALAGVHPLYGLSSGGEEWYLSRRSHLNLRLPRERVADAQVLVGARLDLAGASIEVGKVTEKAITHTPVLYSKFVTLDSTADGLPDEAQFFAACQAELNKLELKPHSVLCGKRQSARAAHGTMHGFSLMVTGLDEAATLCLMKHGLGVERKRGCGIFVPHKSNPADGSY
ncbi:MAG: type I-MYXAN CRISPR-associated protein Cas6/Cmx6 [Pseudomonadota bacterium]